MSDDLAAKAANWVPPWQRPADGESDGEAGAEGAGGAAQDGDGPTPGAGLPGQWEGLAGAKWQTVPQGESSEGEPLDHEALDEEALDDEALDQDRLDPQLSDCVSEDDVDLDDDGDPESIGRTRSWNARALSTDADDAVTGSEDPRAGWRSGDGTSDVVEAEAEGALSGDERVDDARAGDGREWDVEAEGVPSGDERVDDARSEDAESRAGGDGVGAGSAAGPSGNGVAGEVAALDGDAGSKAAGKRSRGKRSGSGGGEGQPREAGAGGEGSEQGQLFVPAQRVPEDRPSINEADLVPALEAILMVVDEPVSELVLAQVLDTPAEQVADALLGLSARYTEEGKGFDLRRAAGGWRFYTRSEYSAYVERFVLDGQQLRLTQASLETLAVVAYKQPVTRSRISAIRGVNCDGVVRTLVTRGLIEECGTEPESGAHLYRTTNLFLEKLGLDSVEQLPPLAPFLPDNLDEVALNE